MRNKVLLPLVLSSIILAFGLTPPAPVAGTWSVPVPTADNCGGTHLAPSTSDVALGALNWLEGQALPMIVAGGYHTVGLRADGSVVAEGLNNWGQCDVGNWANITQVAAGSLHTVGLESDGTVAAAGDTYDYGQCNVGDWDDITQVAAGNFHTVGLESDGTVVAAGLDIELAKWNLGSAAVYLTVSSNTGGQVTGPGEGTFACYLGRLLPLVAKPQNGYRFVKWTGDVDTIARIDSARTNIIMDGDYSVAAEFEKGSPINWPIIGGVIGAVIAAGLAIFFVRRMRTAWTEKRGLSKPVRKIRR